MVSLSLICLAFVDMIPAPIADGRGEAVEESGDEVRELVADLSSYLRLTQVHITEEIQLT